jgi:hypothetical protein
MENISSEEARIENNGKYQYGGSIGRNQYFPQTRNREKKIPRAVIGAN